MRLEQLTTIGDRRIRRDKLQGSDGDLVTHQDRGTRLLRPLSRVAQRAGGFSRKWHAERHTEAEIAEGFVFLTRSETLTKLDDPHVARVADDISERKCSRLVHVVDDAAIELELTVVGVDDVGRARFSPLQ